MLLRWRRHEHTRFNTSRWTPSPPCSRGDEGDHKVRGKAERFADHYTQATRFWNSQTAIEKQHIINASSGIGLELAVMCARKG